MVKMCEDVVKFDEDVVKDMRKICCEDMRKICCEDMRKICCEDIAKDML